MAARGPGPGPGLRPGPGLGLTRQYGTSSENISSMDELKTALNTLLSDRVFFNNVVVKQQRVRALINIANNCITVQEFRESAKIPETYSIENMGLVDYINSDDYQNIAVVGSARRKHRTRRNKKQRKQRKHRTRKH